MSFHPKDHQLPNAHKSAELEAAEAKYTLTAFDLPVAPVGSRDWTLYWHGWHDRSRASLSAAQVPAPTKSDPLDTMVNRFLQWQLPADFSPDCGISFDGRKDDEWNKNKSWPVGTNLLNAEQARQMLMYVVGVEPTAGAAQVPSQLAIAEAALSRIALNISGDTVPQVVAGEALQEMGAAVSQPCEPGQA